MVNSGTGFLRRKRKRRSSTTSTAATLGCSTCMKGSRRAQRLMLATQSFASTRSPSWNFSPVRRVKVTVSPSGSVTQPSAICGRISPLASWAQIWS
jgi:hypothetical protein